MNRKRLIIYSLLALPLVVFTIFFFTLDPIARGTFFREFKVKLAAQFGFEDTNDIQLTDSAVMAQPGGGEFGGDGHDGSIDEVDGGENGTADEGGSGGGGPGGPGGGGPGSGRRGDPAAFFASRDTDGDGKLTGDEIMEFMRPNLDRIDTDGDGSVTLEEFQAARGQFGRGRRGGGGAGGGRGDGEGRGRSRLEENFARQDADGDGQLVGDEISEQMQNNLEQIDSDGNGSITLEELQTFVSQRGNRGGGRGGGSGAAREGRPDRPARPE